MAVDSETKRVSALQAASHQPGKNFMQSEPDNNDLDDANQRGFVLWHYAGISATVITGRVMGSLAGLGGLAGHGGIAGKGGGLAA